MIQLIVVLWMFEMIYVVMVIGVNNGDNDESVGGAGDGGVG